MMRKSQEIQKLDLKKLVPRSNMPPKILKLNKSIISRHLSKIFNENIEKADFPKELKFAYIILAHQKKSALE